MTLQVTGAFSLSLIVEASNDSSSNPSLWNTLDCTPVSGRSAVSEITEAGIYSVPLGYRYLRIRCATYSSGPANITAVFSQEVAPSVKKDGNPILKKTVALTGSGVVHDPAAGKKIRLFNMKFSLSADMTDVAFKFASGAAFEKYLAPKSGGLYGSNLHPDYLEGAVDEVLNCDITGAGTVQINIEYAEI